MGVRLRTLCFSLGILGGALFLGLPGPPSTADTVMSDRVRSERPVPEDYPESRFGFPPAHLDVGVTPGYASRMVQEVEDDPDITEDRGSRKASRSLASSGMEQPSVVAKEQASQNSAQEFSGASARKGVQEIALIASDLGYFPKTVFVTRDVPVRLYVTGASKNTLCVMMDSFQVRKQVRSQKIEEITFIPNIPGKFRFYCPINGMEGSLIVKELNTNG